MRRRMRAAGLTLCIYRPPSRCRRHLGGQPTNQQPTADDTWETLKLVAVREENRVAMYLTLVFLLFALLLFYRYLKENYKLFIKDGVDGPTPVYLLGNLGEFAGKDPLQTFTELTNRFGKVFGFYQGLTPSIVVSDPDLIQQILVKNFSKFSGRPRYFPFLHGEEQEILQNLNGNKWRHMREAMSSAFKNTNIQKMFPKLLHVADQFVDELQRLVLKHPEGFDIQSLNECYALDSVTLATLGLETNAMAHGEGCLLLQYVRAWDDSASTENAVSGLARVYQCLEVLKIVDIKHKRLAKEYFDYLSHHMESERKQMNTSARPKSMLQHLMSYNATSKDDANKTVRSPLTTTEILSLTSGMVVGGVSSTASVLGFTLHCLAVHQRHQEKLRQEVLNVCGVEGNFTIEQVREIDYLDQVINESLRFYPAAPGVARTCSEDCVVNGVQFRAGTEVRLLGITQYKDPDIFPDPLTFKPERFSKDEGSRNPGSWFPFGGGPRMCVGIHLAQLQLKVAIIKLLQNFEISTSDLTQDPLPVTLRPQLAPRNGVHIRLTRIAR